MEGNAKERSDWLASTTLTEYFQLYQQDPFVKTLLHTEVPKHYTWNASLKSSCRRKKRARFPDTPAYTQLSALALSTQFIPVMLSATT